MTKNFALLARFTAALLFITRMLLADIPGFVLQNPTATQAVVSYLAPDTRTPCRIELSESPRYLPLVHDVNPQIFADGDMDLSRRGSINTPQRLRTVVLGKRTAETGRDGKRYSRALQANTKHYLRITCGTLTHTATFDTTNIPLGMTYNDPLPVDPDKPGEYAWPTVDWVDRNARLIDPKTGLLIQHLTMSSDITSVNPPQPVRGGRDRSGTWQDPSAVSANDTRSANTTENDWLFLDAGLSIYLGGTHNYTGSSLESFVVEVNAWCEDCSEIDANGRTLEACLSYDSLSCASKVLKATVEPCTANCTSSRYRLPIGQGGPPVLTAWDLKNGDITDLHRRSGQALRRGNRVLWRGGNYFNLNWKQGSVFELNNKVYTIASVVSEEEIALEGTFENNEESGSYIGSNFGILVRKKAANSARLFVQHAVTSYLTGSSPDWDASGDGVAFTQCAPVQTPGPNGEPGWHCLIGSMLYWIGGETGITSRLGRTYMPSRDGVDGWGFNPGGAFCNSNNGGGPLWDPTDPNVLYCGQIDSTGGVSIIKATYRGANTDIGGQDLYSRLLECAPGRQEPCWDFTNITPVSQGKGLNQQMTNLLPDDFKLLRGASIGIVGFAGDRFMLMARSGNASNDALGVLGAFDPATNRIVAATPSWKYWPLRWTVLHGPEPSDDPEWMSIPATFFRGPLGGDDFLPGSGPYHSRITSGALTATPSACPPRPANSPIAPSDWPTGNQCTEVTVDGEPGDPSPAVVRGGTVSSGPSAGTITGTGVNWQASYSNSQLLIDGRWYTFQYLTATTARISPEPPAPLRNAAYALYLEPVNNPKTGNPLHAYLQDAEVRDVFCVTPDGYCRFLFLSSEMVRLIQKTGNRWILQRGYRVLPKDAGPHAFLPSPANSLLLAVPASCDLGPVYPCAAASVSWSYLQDPIGRNANNATVAIDRKRAGSGHGTIGATALIAAIADTCPNVDGHGNLCYSIRPGQTFAERLPAESFTVPNNAPFQGRIGMGSPNDVDSHPSSRQHREASAPEDRIWFNDARPFLGGSLATGRPDSPATAIEEGLWKFVPGQLSRLRPKYMPTLANCGQNPLLDISGPASRIASPANGGAYTYCYSMNGGECREGSQPGELYVSCPQISRPFCEYSGVGAATADKRDICVVDNGSYTQAITQTRHSEPDTDGAWARILTYGLSSYRWNDLFWNAKSTPDGKWLIFRTPWVNGKRADAYLAKYPPFAPIDEKKRNSYLMQELEVRGSTVAGQQAAMVEFGYNTDFHCTSRRESCVAGLPNDESPFFYSTTEKWTPVDCRDGCTLKIPAIPQRVVYYRVRFFDGSGKQIGESSPSVVAVP